MSKNYDKVKNYYDKGLSDMRRQKKAVGRRITNEDYQNITLVPYQD